MDPQKLIELALAKHSRQSAALKTTLEEISFLEPLELKDPGAYDGALAQLRTKRDRQAKAIRGTEAYINALKKAPKRA